MAQPAAQPAASSLPQRDEWGEECPEDGAVYTLNDGKWHCSWCQARDGDEHRAGKRHCANLIYYKVPLAVQQRWQRKLQQRREEQQQVEQWQQQQQQQQQQQGAAFAPQLQLRENPPPPPPGPPAGDGLIPPLPPPNACDVLRQLIEMTTIFQRQIDELVEKVANLEMRLMQVEQAPVNNWNVNTWNNWWQTPGHSWQQTDDGAAAAAAGSWPQPSGDGAVARSQQTPTGEGSWQLTGDGAVAGSQQALGDAGSSTGDSAIVDWERLKYH